MKLHEAEILKLLPSWMQEDASNKGLAAGTDKTTRAINARLRLLSRWNKLNELTEEELDALALDLAIPWYETAAPLETKRAVIKNRDLVFAKLGTPFAVERIVTDYFGAGEVREWYQYGGEPHHFKILSDNPELVNNNLERFLKLLADAKRRSSWLDAILICLTGEMLLYLWKELSEGYKGVLSVLKTATSLRQASDKVLTDFERPADQSETAKARRASYGQKYLDQFAVKAQQQATPAQAQTGKVTAAALIAIAQAELGYHEKASNAQLDNKTANAGSANFTKYSRDLAAAGYYNGNKQGFAWCDVFVDWCFLQLCGGDGVKAQQVECQSGDCGAGCKYSMQYYQKAGRLYTTPQVGDQIFFQSGGEISHTGIVETVNGTSITTIEGNSSDSVARKSYKTSDPYIKAYGRPRYDGSTVAQPTATTTPVAETVYTVVAGDTLSKIAAKYGTTYQKLAEYNGISNPDVILVGQKIKIPGTSAEIKVGDVVQFAGGPHYASADAKSYTASPKAGPAKVTAIRSGALHPFHVIHTTSASTVYGWVDADKLTRA